MAAVTLEELAHRSEEDINLKDVILGMLDMKKSFNTRLEALENRCAEIDQLKIDVTTLREDMDVVSSQVESLASLESPFPPSTSIILSNFPKPDGESDESLLDAVDVMISSGLNLDEIDVKAVERTQPRTYADAVNGEETAERPGVVKVRLASVEQKIRCLRKKKDLKQKPAYKAVYMRGCEDHASRLVRLNMDTLLEHMEMRDKFTYTGSGRLVKKDSEDDNRRHTRSRTSGQQNANPTQRGGHGGRGRRGGRN